MNRSSKNAASFTDPWAFLSPVVPPRRGLALPMVLGILHTLASLSVAWLMSETVQQAVLLGAEPAPSRTPPRDILGWPLPSPPYDLWLTAVTLLCVIIIRDLVGRAREGHLTRWQQRHLRELRVSTVRRLVSMDVPPRGDRADLVNRVGRDLIQYELAMHPGATALAQNALTGLALGAMAIRTDAIATLGWASVVSLTALGLWRHRRGLVAIQHRWVRDNARFDQWILAAVGGRDLFRLSLGHPWHRLTTEARAEDVATSKTRSRMHMATASVLASLGATLGLATACAIHMRSEPSAHLTLPTLVVTLGWLTRLASSAATHVQGIVQGRVAWDRCMEILRNANPDDRIHNVRAAEPAPSTGQRLKAHNITFAFPGQAPVISGLCFHTSPSAATVVVGPNGTGKTTLLRLCAGLLQSPSGTWSDGATQLSAAERRQRTTWIPHDPTIFPATLWTNVTLADQTSHRDKDHLTKAWCERLGIDRIARKLPDGYDTVLDRDLSVPLSFGERRRVSIARALVTGRPWILWDEPFAGMDPGWRDMISALVQELCTTHLVLLSSHVAQSLPGAHVVPLPSTTEHEN